ncbi:MAG: T9SS type A sorting domain-containing protein, partial [Bacteroidota bacterium]
WEVSLQDFMQNGLSQARALLSHPNKGYIAVASLADLNQDAIPEIIIPQLRESLIVLDGASRQELWRIDEPQHDFYVSPSVGQFTGDATPDVFISAFEGNWPFYQTSLQMLIDGQSGQVVWSERGFPYQMASPVALDWDDDGYDELLFARNQDTASTGRYYQHQLYLYDFNDMLFVPIDTARPGLMSFSMPLIVDLEQDQNWELIFATHDNTSDWYLPEGFSLYCVDLGRFAERLAWGGYQGSQGTGFYPQDLILSLPTEPTATITPYPNPVRDRLFVRSAEGEIPISIQIYDLQGRLVSQVSAKDNITLTQLSPGMYLYAISMKQQIFRGRFHKQ